MDILYMGYFCNEKLFNQLVRAGSKGSHARQQLEMKLLDGFIEVLGDNRLEIVSYLPLFESVKRSARGGEVYHGIKIHYLWCDKHKISSLIHAFRKNLSYIRHWCKGKKEKVVLSYSTNIIHVVPLFLLRKIYKFKVVSLCSEVSTFRRKENMNLFGFINRKVTSFLDNGFDGYILLSEYMNEVINNRKKPYIVMEGVAKEPRLLEGLKKEHAVLYAGGLSEDNGIKILLDGFVQAEIPRLQLWICGEGALEETVQAYVNNYKNIRFFGIISNEQVQKLEQEAELLAAPRYSKNEFTKYSFPSKTIEYMSSGTPTVLTRLKGIPKEYFSYAYVLEDESAKGVCALLKRVFQESEQERKELGQKAKEFVLERKNGQVQAQKVLDFLLKYKNK